MLTEFLGFLSEHIDVAIPVIYLFIINMTAFVLCGIDKYKSKHNLWRISEKTFFTLCLLGGCPFLLVGMKIFRHKTKHKRFTILVPLILIIQIILICLLMYSK